MGSQVSKNVNIEAIQKEIKQSPVVMYSRANCGYCTMAKKLLDDEQITYNEKDLDVVKLKSPSSYQQYVNGLVYLTRQTTVPQIFICGEFIGGYTELAQLKEAQKLLKAVETCANNYL